MKLPAEPCQKRVLVIEDDSTDAMALVRAFSELGNPPGVVVANDATTALETLDLQRASGSHPDLILLDLGLPGMDGAEFVQRLKADRDYCRIPVVVLTASSNEANVRKLYDLQVNGYLVKPSSYQELADLVELIEHYWFGVTRLPD